MQLYEKDELSCQQIPYINFARKRLSFLRSRWIMEKTVAEYLDQLEYGSISQEKENGAITINAEGHEISVSLEGKIFSGEAFLRSSLVFCDRGFTLGIYSCCLILDEIYWPKGISYDAAVKSDLDTFGSALKKDEAGLEKYINLLPNREQFKLARSVLCSEGEYLERFFNLHYVYQSWI